jgi:hypothetical protein
MLSIILYGRNDQHGYNYHKRIAISLNCLAEMLSHPNDEILYVDYNSLDAVPTVVEAIQDTLTTKAKALIRILRIRPSHHDRFASKTPMPLIEPVARNAAIRRSNPENRWILSTNSDMIFVPKNKEKTLSEIVTEIPDGFYSLPRLEVPERFWEANFERSNPINNIGLLRTHYRKLHLNSHIRLPGFLQFDNPGDFQLMVRKHIFQIQGFNEEMLHGWHVDSNLSKRMTLLLGEGKSLEDCLLAFHCNHVEQISFLQNQGQHLENDWNHFVNDIATPSICSQKDWGLANDDIEEISLSHANFINSVDRIACTLNNEMESNYEFLIDADSCNTLTYSSSRIFIYLVDHLATLPKTVNIGYIGYNTELICLLDHYLSAIKFEGKIHCLKDLIDEQSLPASVVFSEEDALLSQVFTFIFDFGFDKDSQLGKKLSISKDELRFGIKKIITVMKVYLDIVKRKDVIHVGTKFIGINVLHTDFHTIFSAHLSMRFNSFVTGISYGYFSRKNKFGWFSGKTIKKRFALALHYLIVRYFFHYSHQIRNFVLRTRIGKKLKKNLT